jgi:aspartyl protease family protein
VGAFTVPIEVGAPDGSRWERIEAMVDTGATLTVIPRAIWTSLGLQPNGSRTFHVADGRQVTLDVAHALIRIDGEEQPNTVVAGPEQATPLLGAVTLEVFFLAVDPVRQRLVPVDGWLL